MSDRPTLTPVQERALCDLLNPNIIWWMRTCIDTRLALKDRGLVAYDNSIRDYRLTPAGRAWLAEHDHAG